MDAPPPEAFSRVRYLYDSLTPKPEELLAKSRYYIREGPLLVWDENRRKKSKRYIFLLNDVLLITKRDGRSKYWLRVFITLRSPNVAVENMSSGFESAFRLSVKTRSFVFFSDAEVDTWIQDVEKCIQGSKNEHSAGNGESKRSKSSNGGSSTTKTGSLARGGQPDFNFFTDGEFQETKVTFDSGVKLGAIRTDSGSGDNVALPILAPPPGRTNSSSMSRSASSLPSSTHKTQVVAPSSPVTTGGAPAPFNPVMTAPAAPPAATSSASNGGNVQSLEEFLGLTPSKPSISATSTNSSSLTSPNLFGSPSQPTKSASDPFGGFDLTPSSSTSATQPNWGAFPAASQPTQSIQPAYTNGNAHSNAQSFNPFAIPASTPSAVSYGTQPHYSASPILTQPSYYGAPTYSIPAAAAAPPQQADPFAALWSSPAPAQPNSSSKQVDFF